MLRLERPHRLPTLISATQVRYGSGSTTPCSASNDRTASQPAGGAASGWFAKTSRRAAASDGAQVSVFMPVVIQDTGEAASRTCDRGTSGPAG